jgi:hypothetical protein
MFILLRDDEGRDELGIGLPRKRLSLPVERPKSVQKVVKSIVNGLVMYVLVQFVLPLLLTMAITLRYQLFLTTTVCSNSTNMPLERISLKVG